jgi:hypothetical protein
MSKEQIQGAVEKVNPKGIKIHGKWFNYSKYMKETPDVNEGDEVLATLDGDFIMKLRVVVQSNGEDKTNNHYIEKMKREIERQVVITRLACLNTATEVLKTHSKPITSETLFRVAAQLEEWAWEGLKEPKTGGEE